MASTSHSISSYEDAQKVSQGGRSKHRRPIANNTWVEPLGFVPDSYFAYGEHDDIPANPDAYGIRLHSTWVVVYTNDGRIILNTGGWLTVTTKDRINTFAPVQVYSVKGQWRSVYQRVERTAEQQPWEDKPYTWLAWDYDNSVPFADGITFLSTTEGWKPVEGTYPDTTIEEQQARARKLIDRDIKKYGKAIEKAVEKWKAELAEHSGLRTSGDCFYCQGIVTTMEGGVADDNDHLQQHLRESYVPITLVKRAYEYKGNFRDPVQAFLMDVQIGLLSRIKSVVAKYLKDRLYPSGLATQHGRKNSNDAIAAAHKSLLEQYVETAKGVLEEPSDFGYFGSDEDLFKFSAPTFGRNRDSEYLENANFEIVWEHLVETFPDLVVSTDGVDSSTTTHEKPGGIYIFRAGHWACGWVEQIVVPVFKDKTKPLTVDNLHPAFIYVTEAAFAVRDYPVLDGAEERAYEAEQADIVKDIASWQDYLAETKGDPWVKAFSAEHLARFTYDPESGEQEYDWFSDAVLKLHAAASYEESLKPVDGQDALL